MVSAEFRAQRNRPLHSAVASADTILTPCCDHMKSIRGKLVAFAALALFSSNAFAQTKTVGAPDDTLFRQIAASDSGFFDAYNNCQLETMKSFITSDVEFYHDQSGLSQSTQADG